MFLSTAVLSLERCSYCKASAGRIHRVTVLWFERCTAVTVARPGVRLPHGAYCEREERAPMSALFCTNRPGGGGSLHLRRLSAQKCVGAR